MIMMKLTVKQFYRIMDLSMFVECLTPQRFGFIQQGMHLIHMGFKTVAHAGSEFAHTSSSMSQGT